VQVTKSPHTIRIGTRGSALALRQTAEVADLLRAAWPVLRVEIQVISTHGDEMQDVPLPQLGSKGVFTSNLETAICDGKIDLAVHSLKDMPTQLPAGLTIGATPRRTNPTDVLVSRQGYTLKTLPHGAKIGTCSNRRTAQLLHQRPDLHIIDIRGNVDTRIQKAFAADSSYDAIVLAYAGLRRLDRLDVISEKFSLDVMLPAPGQGALAVQCRDDARWRLLLKPINNPETEAAVTAERAFLSALGGGCSQPIAALGIVRGESLRLAGRVSALDGATQIDAAHSYPLSNFDVAAAWRAGDDLANRIKERGAEKLLGTFV
jgi:hydroxymethylbilane synthase